MLEERYKMKISTKTIQLLLISFALLLIIITYFYIPKIEEKKLEEKTLQKNEKMDDVSSGTENLFTNVTYEGIYQLENPFVIKAEEAKILTTEPSIVYMNSMHVTITLKSGELIIITSDAGRYDKFNYAFYNKHSFNFCSSLEALKMQSVILILMTLPVLEYPLKQLQHQSKED